MFQWTRPPTGLLLDLAGRRCGAVLLAINDATRQLPAPLVGSEPIPPHQQHPVVFVQHDGQHHPLQSHDLVLKALTVGRMNIDKTIFTHLVA